MFNSRVFVKPVPFLGNIIISSILAAACSSTPANKAAIYTAQGEVIGTDSYIVASRTPEEQPPTIYRIPEPTNPSKTFYLKPQRKREQGYLQPTNQPEPAPQAKVTTSLTRLEQELTNPLYIYITPSKFRRERVKVRRYKY